MTLPSLRVLIVDDQPLFREGLRLILEQDEQIEVVGEASNGVEALEALSATAADVVLMDVRMPRMDGVEATGELLRRHPDSRVIILTTFDADESVFDGLRAGAVGYLLKDAGSEDLIRAIRTAAAGESFLQPSVAAKVVGEFARLSGPGSRRLVANAQLSDSLTNRELEILTHLATGISNQQIARAVYLSEGTVKNHVTRILAKLEVRSREEATARAQELGLL
ncbi:MAG: response regulator transcription factor [Planctomycetota bacterium]